MKTYCVIITTWQAVDVMADSEEQAIELVKSRMQPREAAAASFQIAKEVSLTEDN